MDKVLVDRILELVRGADKIVFDDSLRSAVTQKGRSDFVTRVDTGVQDYLEKELGALCPDVVMVSEEKKERRYDAKKIWILDPIDGTANLIHGFGISGVSLALAEEGEVVFSAVYNPFTKEMFHAVKGEGAWRNGERITCSQTDEMANAIVIEETAPYNKDEGKLTFGMMEALFQACTDTRTIGSSALALCYTACGRADVFCARYLNPWDFAGGLLIAKEAGAIVTDQDGNAVDPTKQTHILCACPALYDEALSIIRGAAAL